MALIDLLAVLLVPGHALLGAAYICGVWLVGAGVIAPLQARVLIGAGEAPDLASTLISSVFNVGIASGAWFGALSLAKGAPLASLPMIGAITMAASCVLVALALVSDRRETAVRIAGPAPPERAAR